MSVFVILLKNFVALLMRDRATIVDNYFQRALLPAE